MVIVVMVIVVMVIVVIVTVVMVIVVMVVYLPWFLSHQYEHQCQQGNQVYDEGTADSTAISIMCRHCTTWVDGISGQTVCSVAFIVR